MRTNRYTQYANDVVSGKQIACKHIQLACSRYLNWLQRTDMYFDGTRADKVINFISHLKHFTGRFNGKPFLLEEWQKWIIYNIFGFYWVHNNKRVIRTVYWEIGRKNGKSQLAAAISLYMMVADGEANAEVEFVASTAKQAGIAFSMSTNLCESIDRKGKYFKRYRDTIKFPKTKSLIQVLSSDAGNQDGYNPSFFVADELHAHPNSALWDVLVSGQGMREEPLAMAVTTAGFNKSSFCYQFRETAIEVVSGLKTDDSLFACIFTLDKDDDYTDENVWIKANPNIDITVQRDYLKQQVQQAKNNNALLLGIITKNFNVWSDNVVTWIPSNYIKNAMQKIDRTKFKDRFCYIGVDLASVSDLTAISYLFPPTKDDPKYYFFTDVYLPEDTLNESPNTELYKQWNKQGYLRICDGNVTSYDDILQDILANNDLYLIQSIAYDSWNAVQWAIAATGEGLPLMPFSQALGNFNRPTKEFERLVRSGQMVIEESPITSWCFQNVALKADYHDNIKPVKGGNSNQKIDIVIAMLQALGRYIETPCYDMSI